MTLLVNQDKHSRRPVDQESAGTVKTTTALYIICIRSDRVGVIERGVIKGLIRKGHIFNSNFENRVSIVNSIRYCCE